MMQGEPEWISKKNDVAYYKELTQICLERLQNVTKTSVRESRISLENRNRCFHDKSRELLLAELTR